MIDERTQLKRAELEGAAERIVCPIHGRQQSPGTVCVACYDIQAERVERESAVLRAQNTAQALRQGVLIALARANGHAARRA